jgi:hypothetical protein
MDPNIIDTPKLIRDEKISDEASSIKQLEDMLSNLLNSDKKSKFIEDPYVFLWDVSELNDIIISMKEINFDDFELNVLEFNNLLITGPFIRSIFRTDDLKIRNEIILEWVGDEHNNIINNFKKFKELDDRYIRKIGNKTVIIMKESISSTSRGILKYDYLKRVGYFNGQIYVSSMFLVEYNRRNIEMMTNLKDPVFNTPIDLFDIYYKKQITNNIFDMIDKKDLDDIFKIKSIHYESLRNGLTPIEYAISKYIVEDHPILMKYLEKIIFYLNSFNYKRSPKYYSKLKQLDMTYPELFISLKENKDELHILNQINSNHKTIDDINQLILLNYIENDNENDFFNFVDFLGVDSFYKIIDLDKLVELNATNIIRKGIIDETFSEYNIYKIILFSQNLDLFRFLQKEFNIEIAINFLEDLVKKGLYKSFYYVYKNDNEIISMTFENNNNLLHIVNDNNKNYVDMIQLLLKLNPEIINKYNDSGETPIVYHSKKSPNIVRELLKQNDLNVTIFDNNGNSFIHNLVQETDYETLKLSLHLHPHIYTYLSLLVVLLCLLIISIRAFRRYSPQMRVLILNLKNRGYYLSLNIGISILTDVRTSVKMENKMISVEIV